MSSKYRLTQHNQVRPLDFRLKKMFLRFISTKQKLYI